MLFVFCVEKGNFLSNMNEKENTFRRLTEEPLQHDITADEIVEIINILNDDEKFEKKLVWARLQQSDEEAA